MRLALLPLVILLAAPRAVHAQQDSPRGALIIGMVVDSASGRPLGDAMVQLVSAGPSGASRTFTAMADSAGAFRIHAVPDGDYIAGFFHPVLDTLGIEPPARRVTVRGGDPVRLELGIPSERMLTRAYCPAGAPRDSTGIAVGLVRDAESGAPLAGAAVTVSWTEIVFDRRGIAQRRPSLATRTNDAGWFVVCGIPAPTEVAVQGVRDSLESGVLPLEVAVGGVARLGITLGRAERVVVAAGDSAGGGGAPRGLVVRRGTARITGVVRGRESGAPVGGASVRLWGSEAEATSDSAGAFALAALPAGTRTVEVRAIGFTPRRVTVALAAERTSAIEVTMEKAVVLADVDVTATRLYSRAEAEFERRRRRGLGHFIGADEIRKRNAVATTDLLRSIPSVRVIPLTSGGYTVSMARGITSLTGGGNCMPTVYLDGMRLPPGPDPVDIDLLVRPGDIAGIEVYAGPGQTPAELMDTRGCGAIVIHTQTGATLPKPKKKG